VNYPHPSLKIIGYEGLVCDTKNSLANKHSCYGYNKKVRPRRIKDG